MTFPLTWPSAALLSKWLEKCVLYIWPRLVCLCTFICQRKISTRLSDRPAPNWISDLSCQPCPSLAPPVELRQSYPSREQADISRFIIGSSHFLVSHQIPRQCCLLKLYPVSSSFLALRKQRQVGLCELDTSLVYIVNSDPAGATQWDAVSGKIATTNQK